MSDTFAFSLSQTQQKLLAAFLKTHNPTCPYADPMKQGAIGGRLVFEVCPTTIDTFLSVRCACGGTASLDPNPFEVLRKMGKKSTETEAEVEHSLEAAVFLLHTLDLPGDFARAYQAEHKEDPESWPRALTWPEWKEAFIEHLNNLEDLP